MSDKEQKTSSALYGTCCATGTAILNYSILKFMPNDAKELTIIASYLSYAVGYLIYLLILRLDNADVAHLKKRLKQIKYSLNDPNVSQSEKDFYQKEYDEIHREMLKKC